MKMAIFCIAVLLSCVFIGCSNGDPGQIPETNLTEFLDFPMAGNIPQAHIDAPWFTGEIEWFFAEEVFDAQDGFFESFTDERFTRSFFRSVLTLTAKDGFSFTGISANSFIHDYAYAARNSAGSGGTLTVTLEFPYAPFRNTNPVTMTNLLYTLLQPVTGETPQRSITASQSASQYTGDIQWSDANWNFLQQDAVFLPNTEYTALVNLVPGQGYRMSALSAESFTHSGARSIRYNRLQNMLTVEFNATRGENITVHSITNFNLGTVSELSQPRMGQVPPVSFSNAQQYTGTMEWLYSDDDTPVSGSIAYGRPLKVVVQLTARSGYTFTGVMDNAFIHPSTAVTDISSQGSLVTIYFAAPIWEIGSNTVSFIPIAPEDGVSVKACCFHTSYPPHHMINGDISTTRYQYGSDAGNSDNNDSSWPTFFMRHHQGEFIRENTITGHPSVFLQPDIPDHLRIEAHVFTLDLGRVVDNIVRIGFNSYEAFNFPYEGEVYFSTTEIGPMPGSNTTLAGHFSRSQQPGIAASQWGDYDIFSAVARPFSARYIHVRIFKTQDTMGPGGTIDITFRHVRIGTVAASAYPGN